MTFQTENYPGFPSDSRAILENRFFSVSTTNNLIFRFPDVWYPEQSRKVNVTFHGPVFTFGERLSNGKCRSGFGMQFPRGVRRSRRRTVTRVVHNRNIDGLSLVGFSYRCKTENPFDDRICGKRDGTLIPGPIPTYATGFPFFNLRYPHTRIRPNSRTRTLQRIRFKLTTCFDVPNDPDA